MPFRHLTQWPELRSSARVIILGIADRLSTLEREREKERERGGGEEMALSSLFLACASQHTSDSR
jgi:hypothetical protein